MKRLAAAVLFVPALAAAQNYQGMSEKEMQAMMQQMQKAGACMQNIDQAKMRAIEQQSRQVEAEIKSLCNSGKRDAAQERAISYGREMSEDPTVLEMRKCGEQMRGAMPNMPYMAQRKKKSSGHICD